MNHVAIFGAPRSGTSWLGQLFNSSPQVAYRFQPLFSYAFKGRLSEESTSEEIRNFYKELLETSDDFVMQRRTISGKDTGLSFRKKEPSCLVWKEVRYHYVIEALLKRSDTQIVGIVRHPCAVIHSWLNAPKEFDPSWDPLDEWRFASKKNLGRKEEYNGYEKWKVLAFGYMRLARDYPDRFRTVVYEDLNLDTTGQLKSLYDFCGLPWSEQTDQFIRSSKSTDNEDPYGVFRKQKRNNEWEGSLPADIENSILTDPDFHRLNSYYRWNF